MGLWVTQKCNIKVKERLRGRVELPAVGTYSVWSIDLAVDRILWMMFVEYELENWAKFRHRCRVRE